MVAVAVQHKNGPARVALQPGVDALFRAREGVVHHALVLRIARAADGDFTATLVLQIDLKAIPRGVVRPAVGAAAVQHIGAPGECGGAQRLAIQAQLGVRFLLPAALQPHVGEAAAHQHGGGTDDGGAPHVEQFLRAAWGVATVVGVDAPAAKHPGFHLAQDALLAQGAALVLVGLPSGQAAFGFVVEGGFKANLAQAPGGLLAALGVGVAGGGQGAAIDGGCGAALAPNDFRHLIPATNGLQQSALPLGVEVLAQRLVVGKCLLRALHAGLFCLGQARLRCAAQGRSSGLPSW